MFTFAKDVIFPSILVVLMILMGTCSLWVEPIKVWWYGEQLWYIRIREWLYHRLERVGVEIERERDALNRLLQQVRSRALRPRGREEFQHLDDPRFRHVHHVNLDDNHRPVHRRADHAVQRRVNGLMRHFDIGRVQQRVHVLQCSGCLDDLYVIDQKIDDAWQCPCSAVTYCSSCIVRYAFSEGFRDNVEARMVTCAVCHAEAKMGTCRQLMSDAVYMRYEKLLLKKALLNMRDIVWCPGTDCPVVSLQPACNTKKKNKNFHTICRHCATQYCWNCGHTWTKKHKCHEARAKVSRELVNVIDFYCRHCHTAIEKNGGCKHMRCTARGEAFRVT